MAYGLKQLVAPTSEPVTIGEAKEHLYVDDDVHTSRINGLIRVARRYCENWLGCQLVTSTWLLALDRFPSLFWIGSWGNSYQDYQGYQGPSQGAGQGNWQWTLDGKTIRMPRPPLQAVASIVYVDTAGVQQTLAPDQYQAATTKFPGLLTPAYGLAWPIARAQLESVQVTFLAGYGSPADVPDTIKQAMLLLIGHWYENREAVGVVQLGTPMALAVESLLMSEWSGEIVG